jgi:iron-sulfur cluster assembly protein
VPAHKFYITQEAFDIVDATLTKRNLPKILRIGIKGAQGCNGFKYRIECAEFISEGDDVQFDCQNNVFIVIDAKSMRHLDGATLLWVDDSKSRGLKLINPNQKTTCGCGDSFSV